MILRLRTILLAIPALLVGCHDGANVSQRSSEQQTARERGRPQAQPEGEPEGEPVFKRDSRTNAIVVPAGVPGSRILNPDGLPTGVPPFRGPEGEPIPFLPPTRAGKGELIASSIVIPAAAVLAPGTQPIPIAIPFEGEPVNLGEPLPEGEPVLEGEPVATGVPGFRGGPLPEQCTTGYLAELRSVGNEIVLFIETTILTPLACANALIAFEEFQVPVTASLSGGSKAYTGETEQVRVTLIDNRFALFAGFAPPPWQLDVKKNPQGEETEPDHFIGFQVNDNNLDTSLLVEVTFGPTATDDVRALANVDQVFASLRIQNAFKTEGDRTVLAIATHLPTEVVLNQVKAVKGVDKAAIATAPIIMFESDRLRRIEANERRNARAGRSGANR
jgi:hypothetical protein